MKKSVLSIAAFSVLFCGCSSVTLRDRGTQHLATEPNYNSSQSFFFWGLAGDKHIDVEEICGKAGAAQLQTQTTFGDGLLRLITLGIYSPRTARVWCGTQT